MPLANLKVIETNKDLNRLAARLMCSVRLNLSRPLISLEKKGASDAWRFEKPDRELLIVVAKLHAGRKFFLYN
jgi:hypothetical protein